ncbi:hypothetical protein HanRHA438_Chr07g0290641 [Helianthus annuus]|nr:hypothetical protein HanIR_Chr07g0301521 [Helianthus annuus]KAJ0906734.1 hypothetical protein HanRHA438_Chr07g0290641 [Helianthus annuus]
MGHTVHNHNQDTLLTRFPRKHPANFHTIITTNNVTIQKKKKKKRFLLETYQLHQSLKILSSH